MNGLLAVCKQKEIPFSDMKGLLDRGLDMMSHSRARARTFVLLNKKLQKEKDSVRLALGACSSFNHYSNMASEDGDILIFEGRLLNKPNLLKYLSLNDGNNAPDAEVVLQLIKERGVYCFSLMHGFWSLIYLDAKNKTLYGARDHFGNRPLWFCHTPSHFAMASESRTLFSLCDDARTIDRNTVIDFLLWGNIGVRDQYFFNDIHSIEPSHYVKYEMETHRLKVERYYSFSYNRNTSPFNETYAIHYNNILCEKITDTVEKHLSLLSGTLAAGVSGGMDSSSLLCLSKKINPDRNFVAYTVTDNYDGGESVWAEKVVRHTGVEWVQVVCSADDIIEKLEPVNRLHNTPVYNASTLVQFRMMEEIQRQGQTVFFDGQGGDELFGGYPSYFPLFLQSLRKNGEWKRWWRELMRSGNSGLSAKELLSRRFKLWAKTHYYSPKVLAQKKRKDIYESLMPEVRDAFFEAPSPVKPIEKEVLNDALFESYTLFLGNILRWGEQSAATQGVECVMPLSDNPELTEWVFSAPSWLKIHDGWNKYMLRQAMAGIVPDEIRLRKQKMGFYFPEQRWLNDFKMPLISAFQNREDPEECLNKKFILAHINRLYTPGNLLYQQFVFRCYSYLLWRNSL